MSQIWHKNKINSNEQKTAGISDTDETESEIDSSASEKNGSKPKKNISGKRSRLQFPESWEDKYVILEDDTGFSVFQKNPMRKKKGWDTFWHFEGHGMVSGCCRCKYFRIYR